MHAFILSLLLCFTQAAEALSHFKVRTDFIGYWIPAGIVVTHVPMLCGMRCRCGVQNCVKECIFHLFSSQLNGPFHMVGETAYKWSFAPFNSHQNKRIHPVCMVNIPAGILKLVALIALLVFFTEAWNKCLRKQLPLMNNNVSVCPWHLSVRKELDT